MKKSFVSALTTSIVIGVASTTFAAANPFSDVPTDHWAYDAVSQLVADGVIEGYGDTTFRGNQSITRYEMAQMVAKAMARDNVSAADKALIDKLAAEFSGGLNNLGVRVSNLERNADAVKWKGMARYTYWSRRNTDEGSKKNDDQLLLRLEPTAEVNRNWHVKSRIEASTDLAKDTSGDSDKHGDRQDTTLSLKRIWAQGNYPGFQVKLGKFAPIDDDTIFYTNFSGVEVKFGNKVTFTASAGRKSGLSSLKTVNNAKLVEDETANYQYAGLGYKNGKFVGGLDFHHLNADNFLYIKDNLKSTAEKKKLSKRQDKEDNANIWLLKADYRFNKFHELNGFYANNTAADDLNKAWSIEYDYRKAKAANQGSWGVWMAYRYLGDNTALFSIFNAVRAGQQAWEVGARYVPVRNTLVTLRYANGKDIATDTKIENLFGRVEFFF